MKSLFTLALVAASLVALPAIAGPPLRINFQNASALPVTQLFIRIAGSKDWGTNQAGAGIAARSMAQVMLADGVDKCIVDIKLKTKAGADFGVRVSLCQTHTFVYHGQM